MGLNWNLQRGGRIQTKKPSVGGVWIFSGTTHLVKKFNQYTHPLRVRNIVQNIKVETTAPSEPVMFHLSEKPLPEVACL